MARDIFSGSTGNLAAILIMEDGAPKLGVAWDTVGLVIGYRVDTGLFTPIALNSGNWFEDGGGSYYVTVDNSVYLAANLGKLIKFSGTLAGADIYGEYHRVVANDPTVNIATAVVERAVSAAQPVGSVGYILYALSTMIKYVGGFWLFKASAVTEVDAGDRNEIF